jgi:hypothetical protein
MYEAFSYLWQVDEYLDWHIAKIRRPCTQVKLLVYEALSSRCMRP